MRFLFFLLVLVIPLVSISQDENRRVKALVSTDVGYAMSGLTISAGSGVLFKEIHELGAGYAVNQSFSSFQNLYQGYQVSYNWWINSVKHPRVYFAIGPFFRHMFGRNSSYIEGLINMNLKVRIVKSLFFQSKIGVGLHAVVSSNFIPRLNGQVAIGLSYEI